MMVDSNEIANTGERYVKKSELNFLQLIFVH